MSVAARVPHDTASAAGGFAGRVTLTVPLGTVADLADRPGELAGHGPVDPWLARDLAAAAAQNPKTTWCVTVANEHGHAVGHGCARPEPKGRRERAGPGPPGFSFTPAAPNAIWSHCEPLMAAPECHQDVKGSIAPGWGTGGRRGWRAAARPGRR